MRVRQGGAVRTSPRSRPCSQQQQQQQAVYKIYEGKEPLVLLGGAGKGGFETGRNPMSMICGEKNAGGGGFRLIRHHSAINEHDIRTNSSSLLRTVSELREELHLGLPRKKNNQKTALDVVSGFPAITTDAKKNQTSCGTRSDAALKLFTEAPHQVPLFPGAKKARHLDGFVYKNYSLQNRRTLSFPVGKEYLINEYVGKRKGRQQQSTPPPPLPRSFSFTTTRLTETLTVAKDDTGAAAAVSCNMDFDAEVDRHSKMDLFLQAAYAVLTTVAGIFTVYIYMQFFMSSRHDGGLLHHQQEVPLQHESSFAALQEEEEDLGPVSFFYYCNMLARVLFFPLLAILIAVVCAIITSRAWRNFLHGDSMWSRSHDVDTCSHCEEVEDSRMRIEQADEKVQRAQQAKQQFMAYVFHNIRVPFNAIVLGLGHMQASGDGEGPIGSVADKMDLVQMMLDCAETMTSVLDDVTDMGELEVGQMELHSDEFDILAVIKFLSWGLKDLLQQKEIAFNMDVDKTVSQLLTSHFVLGDKQRIVQTLGNFLSNAVKFTPAGGKLDLKVHCEEVVEKKHVDLPFIHETSSSSSESVTRTGDPLLGVTGTSILTKTSSQTKHGIDKVARIHISVKDNGIGISAEDQAKLFEPYSFVTSGWVQKGGVSGLGLSMAKHYVERVGGNIGVESSVGEGSTFFFSIPFPLVPRDDNNKTEVLLSNSEASESTGNDFPAPQKTIARRRKSMEQEGTFVQNRAATKPAESKQKDSGHRQRKVLLVEDTRINRIILRKVLQNLNLLCDEAENGKIAVDLHVQGNSYDLVLMDKEMPVMDGHEATRQLRLMGVKTPIIALTGNALQSDRELFFEAGVNDFQTKPLSRDKLVQLLIRHGVESSMPAAG